MIRTVGKLILILVYIGFILLIAPVSVWLLFNAQTWVGIGLATSGLISVILPLTCLFWYRLPAHRQFWRGTSFTLALSLIVVLNLILLNTPIGHPPPNSPVSHRFTTSTTFPRYTLPNIVPEVEQLNLGFFIMAYLDPILTTAQADRLSILTFNLYRDMENDPNFHELGSVMGWSYAELFRREFDVGHYYLYIPKNRPQGPLPVLVFLHGSAGNFKGYLWLWSKLAEKHGMVIIAPSFGFGNWRPPGGIESVLTALDDAATTVEIDPDRVYLAGISNGGLGVSQLAEAAPERFRGLIFLSPVMATEIVDGETFQTAWHDRPVLVITGEVDRRVPVEYVTRRISNLKTGGVAVSSIIYPDEDHFLFFSQPESILSDISKWLLEINGDL